MSLRSGKTGVLRNMRSLYRDEKGLTTVEWAVLARMVAAIAITGGVIILGGITSATGVIANKVQNTINNASVINSW
jgi:Flp pilus assembly pilin Flp